MIDHAHELRRHARKIGHPAGDTPAVMRDAAAHIDDLERRLQTAESRVAVAVEAEREAKSAPEMNPRKASDMAITGGFGMMMDINRGGAMRRWVMGRDGVKRWLDSGEPCESHKPYNPDEDPTAGKPWPTGLDSGRLGTARKIENEPPKGRG